MHGQQNIKKYTEHVSALILYLVHVFYTLEQGLSEMVEVVTPVYTLCKQFSCGSEDNPDTLQLE